jgi:TRAP-type transport system periplasmic protein
MVRSRQPLFQARRSFIVGSAAAVATFGMVAAPAKAAEFEYKCASANPFDHPTTIRLGQMWNAVEKESGGRLRTQLFPNSQLGSGPAVVSQLRLGGVQFMHANPGDVAAAVPLMDICFLGFAFKDVGEALRTLSGPLANYLREETAAKGLHLMRAVWDARLQQIVSATHPVQTADDLRNFKIRVAESKIQVSLFRELGATPTPLPLTERYTGLQTRLIDGAASPFDGIETGRLYEVSKYISLTNHSLGNEWLVANGDAWKRLPTDLQLLVERNNAKFAKLEQRDLDELNVMLASKLKTQGIIFNTVDPSSFRARLGNYYKDWSVTFGPAAWGVLQSSLGRKLT